MRRGFVPWISALLPPALHVPLIISCIGRYIHIKFVLLNGVDPLLKIMSSPPYKRGRQSDRWTAFSTDAEQIHILTNLSLSPFDRLKSSQAAEKLYSTVAELYLNERPSKLSSINPLILSTENFSFPSLLSAFPVS